MERERQRGVSYPQLSTIISVVLVLHTLALLPFFVFDPFVTGVSALAILQFASQIAWVLLVFMPPLVLWGLRSHYRLSRSLLLISALLWPATILLIRLAFAVMQQPVSFAYLFEYPMFVFSDIITPIIYVLVWRALSRKNGALTGRSSQPTRESGKNGVPLESGQVATRRTLNPRSPTLGSAQ